MDILFIDLETTGLDPKENSIIQIAARAYKDGKEVNRFSRYCFDRTAKINMNAMKINKTKIADLVLKSHESEVLKDFADFLISLDLKDKTIAGHNVGFDISFMKERLSKYSIDGWDDVTGYRIQDTSVIGKFLMEAGIIDGSLGKSGTGLKNIAKVLGLEVNESRLHNADTDVDLTAQVYYGMLDKATKLVTSFPRPISLD